MPFILRWPEADMAGGRDVNDLCLDIDMLSSLTELCGVPAVTTKFLPPFVSHGSDEPQILQNDVAKYFDSGSSNLLTDSSPLSHLNCSGGTKRLAA